MHEDGNGDRGMKGEADGQALEHSEL